MRLFELLENGNFDVLVLEKKRGNCITNNMRFYSPVKLIFIQINKRFRQKQVACSSVSLS